MRVEAPGLKTGYCKNSFIWRFRVFTVRNLETAGVLIGVVWCLLHILADLEKKPELKHLLDFIS